MGEGGQGGWEELMDGGGCERREKAEGREELIVSNEGSERRNEGGGGASRGGIEGVGGMEEGAGPRWEARKSEFGIHFFLV